MSQAGPNDRSQSPETRPDSPDEQPQQMALGSKDNGDSRGHTPLLRESFAMTAGNEALLCKKYQALAQHHVGTLPALFTNCTGLVCQLCWASNWPHQRTARKLATGSRLCRGVAASCPANHGRCDGCTARHLARALRSPHKGHRFTCYLGIYNFWQPLTVRGRIVGLAFVQALSTAATDRNPAPRRPSAAMAAAMPPGSLTTRLKRVSRREFGKAIKLLRLMIQHVETAALADLSMSDLARTQQALLQQEAEGKRLRGELNGLVPAFSKATPVLESENHIDRAVHAALDYIHQNYSHALSLQECADRLRLNPAYFSAQFSRAVGIPFKSYLTELRVEKARSLLADLTQNIADVAYAVGYSSENRFRLAFKKVTGLPPRLWRETSRVPCAAILGWLLAQTELLERLEEWLEF